MKKLAVILMVLSLFQVNAYASHAVGGLYEMTLLVEAAKAEEPEPHEDDSMVSDLFFRYADSLAEISFSEIHKYLVDAGYTFQEKIGDNKLATFNVECPVGEVYFCFYPLDISAASTAFGDPDREILSCVQYKRGERWISVSDEFHTDDVIYTIGDPDASSVRNEMSKLELLRLYYNYRMGGNVAPIDSE